MKTFTNTSHTYLRVRNTRRLFAATIDVGGARIRVPAGQGKLIGPFPQARYGPIVEYTTSSPRLLVDVVDVATLPETMTTTSAVVGNPALGPSSIQCPQCGRVSHNPTDAQQRYCGHCHQYHSDMA